MNILIVDDERNIRFTLKDILEDEGHQIFLADSGENGIKRLSQENIQMVILDVKLPGIDGIETYKKMEAQQPGLDVVIISGHSDIQTAIKAVKLGAYDFQEKPLSMSKILTSVRNVAERHKLLNRLQHENENISVKNKLIGNSPEIKSILSRIDKIGPTDSKVLILGESGTGKELVAYAIQNNSRRKLEPYIIFNSAAIPTELVESELFGHEKGAFTGADQQKQGKLELAHGGTLFLDEIGDMNLNVQAKVLRVIQEGTFERVGGNKTIKIDVRILAATHKNLEEMINAGVFREDLYYRLNVIPIFVPPLRERTSDISELADHFLRIYANVLRIPVKTLNQEALNLLEQYSFPGNVRELKNLMERISILVSGKTILAKDIHPYLKSTGSRTELSFLKTKDFKTARLEFEKYFLTKQLNQFGWKIGTVAEKLKMKQPNLSRKIKELDIEK